MHRFTRNFTQVSSAWSVKIIKEDKLKLMRIDHNVDHEYEAAEFSCVFLNKQAASVTLTKSRLD